MILSAKYHPVRDLFTGVSACHSARMAPLPTFDVATTDPAVLRTVARSAASPSARGDELMLIASNSAGGALALNALLGLEALGYRHALLLEP